MIVAIGYAAIVLNVAGNLLLAHKNMAGWAVRLLTNAAWIAYAVQVESGEPMAVNHVLFMGINLYGLWKWTGKPPVAQ